MKVVFDVKYVSEFWMYWEKLRQVVDGQAESVEELT